MLDQKLMKEQQDEIELELNSEAETYLRDNPNATNEDVNLHLVSYGLARTMTDIAKNMRKNEKFIQFSRNLQKAMLGHNDKESK